MIQRMIDDHKSSVESACETARDIQSHTDDAREKRLVSSDIDRLMTSWNAVNSTAASQLSAVEAALAASNDYHSKADPFAEWLDSMKKKVAGLELQTADTADIQRQIALQRVTVFLSTIFTCQFCKRISTIRMSINSNLTLLYIGLVLPCVAAMFSRPAW